MNFFWCVFDCDCNKLLVVFFSVYIWLRFWEKSFVYMDAHQVFAEMCEWKVSYVCITSDIWNWNVYVYHQWYFDADLNETCAKNSLIKRKKSTTSAIVVEESTTSPQTNWRSSTNIRKLTHMWYHQWHHHMWYHMCYLITCAPENKMKVLVDEPMKRTIVEEQK